MRRLWEGIQAKAETVPAPGLVWQDLRLLQKVMRDIFREEVSTFWVDDDAAHREVVSFVENIHPEWSNRVKRFTSDLPIFEAFGIESEIDSARQPKVFLKHGGSIVLNQTEALVSVDVNTGKFVGKKDLEETVYLTNLEAIPEIVRQLRLRNLGGIVVIDFIDMVDPLHRDEVLARFQEELKRDRNHARAGGISEFGLVELTRKRTGPSLERQLTQPCPTCNGAGRTQSPETSLLKAYRELVRLGERLRGADVRLTLHPELSASLHQESRESLMQLARLLGARVSWIERADTPRHAVVMDLQFPGQDSASA
ncbi:MAG: ribonuclease E/G [Geothrix sp.]|uniref:ribonuclease E/G n=1 Tax=Geothrix sp. TaxID=1962974 RepID=UPI0017C5A2E3|nr:ribonuclease E/G [Geothrix sp.]NWJ41660.1 ribonuclease E/G [Geothrix sp.]